jgi:hypothetical protein
VTSDSTLSSGQGLSAKIRLQNLRAFKHVAGSSVRYDLALIHHDAPSGELARFITPETADAIPSGDVIDLTSKMKQDGTLEWDAPAGNWVVLRMGYSLSGRTNHSARKYTYTTIRFYRADSPLLPSGLLGPVQFIRVATE